MTIHSCGIRLRARSVIRLLLLLEVLYGFHMCQVNMGSTCQCSEGAGLTCGQFCWDAGTDVGPGFYQSSLALQLRWVLGKSFRSCVSRRGTERKSHEGFNKLFLLFLIICICVLFVYVHVGVYMSVGDCRGQRH